MRQPYSKTRGFTLLEVMLAILLLAMLLAGTFGAVRTATKATQSGEAAVDRINRMRVAQALSIRGPDEWKCCIRRRQRRCERGIWRVCGARGQFVH